MKYRLFIALWFLSFAVSLSGRAFSFQGYSFSDASPSDVRGSEMSNILSRCAVAGSVQLQKCLKKDCDGQVSAVSQESFDASEAHRASSEADHCAREEAAGDYQTTTT